MAATRDAAAAPGLKVVLTGEAEGCCLGDLLESAAVFSTHCFGEGDLLAFLCFLAFFAAFSSQLL